MTSKRTAEWIRSQLAMLEPGRRRRYPARLRAAMAEYVRARVATGESPYSVAPALGIRPRLAYRLLQAARKEPSPAVLRPVTVVASEEVRPGGPVVVVPGGVRVEGLDLDGVAKLLRRLA